MRYELLKKSLVIGIILLFIGENVILIANGSSGTPPEMDWKKTFGVNTNSASRDNRACYSFQQLNDGGLIFVGATWEHNGDGDFWIFKINANGDQEWSNIIAVSDFDEYGGYDESSGIFVQQISNGGYFVIGKCEGTSDGVRRDVPFFIKTDSKGSEQSEKFLGLDTYLQKVRQTYDGGFILLGGAELIKTDSEGNLQWNRTFPSVGGFAEYTDVQPTVDNGYIMCGGTLFQGKANEGLIVKMDATGNEQWNKTFRYYSNKMSLDSIQQATDGGYIALGSEIIYGGEYRNFVWLIKTDSNGDEIWNKTFRGTTLDYIDNIQKTADDGYIITGGTITSAPNNDDIWLMKIDGNGVELWNTTVGQGQIQMGGVTVQQTNTGGFLILANDYSNAYYPWLVKLKPLQSPGTNLQGDGNNTGDSKGTPGFELVFVLCAIAVALFLWRKKRSV